MRALLGLLCVLAGALPVSAQSWPSERAPRPLAAREAKFPPYELRTLPNGLQVIAVLHHEQPVVSMRMIVKAGGALDAADRLGTAALTAALLTQGTTEQSATEMNDAIDFIGGSIDAVVGSRSRGSAPRSARASGLDTAARMARASTVTRGRVDRRNAAGIESIKLVEVRAGRMAAFSSQQLIAST